MTHASVGRPDKDNFLQWSGIVVAIILFMWPPATLFSAPEAWRWIWGEQSDGSDACSASLEANIRRCFKRTAATVGSNCEQPTVEGIVRYMPNAVCTITNVVFKIDYSRFGVDISRSAMPFPAHKSTAGFGTEAKRGLNVKLVALPSVNEPDMPS
jgi:hypothetical protein